jgi:hypothetical protein
MNYNSHLIGISHQPKEISWIKDVSFLTISGRLIRLFVSKRRRHG